MKMIATDDLVIENSIMADSLNTEIGINENTYNMVQTENNGGIPSILILAIVVGICVILGIGLGILSGKRSANK